MKLFTLLVMFAHVLAVSRPKENRDSLGRPLGKNFQQFGQLIFENTNYATAEANAVFKSIRNYKNNRLLSQMYAVEHPSLPNYIAMIAGTTFGVKDDRSPATYNFTNSTIIDLLEAKGISWKMYAEDYPGNCYTGPTNKVAHSYAAKHVPAVYFQSITTNPKRCANVVPAKQFQSHFKSGQLPQWWFYVPSLLNDGHDTDVDYMGNYLTTHWIPRLRNKAFTKDLAMVITFDESETKSGPNHVFAVLVGDALKPKGHSDTAKYTHYSLMKTVEDNWDLGSVKRNDTAATSIIM